MKIYSLIFIILCSTPDVQAEDQSQNPSEKTPVNFSLRNVIRPVIKAGIQPLDIVSIDDEGFPVNIFFAPTAPFGGTGSLALRFGNTIDLGYEFARGYYGDYRNADGDIKDLIATEQGFFIQIKLPRSIAYEASEEGVLGIKLGRSELTTTDNAVESDIYYVRLVAEDDDKGRMSLKLYGELGLAYYHQTARIEEFNPRLDDYVLFQFRIGAQWD